MFQVQSCQMKRGMGRVVEKLKPIFPRSKFRVKEMCLLVAVTQPCSQEHGRPCGGPDCPRTSALKNLPSRRPRALCSSKWGHPSSSPRHSAIIQTFFSPELHHQPLLQILRPHLHDLAVRLLLSKMTVSEEQVAFLEL